jgi:nitroreductase
MNQVKDTSELVRILQSRSSIRSFKNTYVPVSEILEIIHLACLSPSGGNHQPWHFHVINNRKTIEKITKFVENAHLNIQSWTSFYLSSETLWYKKSNFIKTAPVCIAVSVNMELSGMEEFLTSAASEYREAKDFLEARNIGNSRLQSIGAVISTFLLLCEEKGLGACWMASPQLAKKEIEELLDISTNWAFVALIPVGYPNELPKPKDRKPVEELVTIID